MALTVIFRLQVLHNYFSDGRCKDLRVVPDDATVRYFERHRMSWTFEENTLHVAGSVNDQQALVIPASKGALSFYLYQTSRYVREYTVWPEVPPGQELVFENDTAGEGKYSLLPRFKDPENSGNAARGFLAKILVNLDGSDLGTGKIMTVSLSLEASAVVWKYYYIGRQYSALPEIAQLGDEIQFNKREFDSRDLEDVDEPLIKKLGAEFPNSRLGLYESSQPVTWRESRYQNIQMKKEGEIIFKNLRNPNWKTQGVEIINSL